MPRSTSTLCASLLIAWAVLSPCGSAQADGDDVLGPSHVGTYTGGGVVSEGIGLAQRDPYTMPTTGTITIAGIPPGASVVQAWLYWMITGGLGDDAVELDGQPVVGDHIGTTRDTCWGYGSNRTYRADVTGLVAGNGSYDVGELAWLENGIDAQGASLVVIYEDPLADTEGTVVIHDGAFRVDDVPSATTLSGFVVPQDPLLAQVHFLAGDGQEWLDSPKEFEGQLIEINGFQGLGPGGDGGMWDDDTHDVTGWVQEGMTEVVVDPAEGIGSADCVAVAVLVFDYIIGPPCDDLDGDGFPDQACGGTDCEDEDPAIHPATLEIPYDGVDQDCDGVDLNDVDGDGVIGWGGGGVDCDDEDHHVFPGAAELCDGVDQDCDGVVDEDTVCVDDDGDGYSEDAGDCDDGDAAIYPGAPEVCDGADQDCDGVVDDGTACVDDDGDGWTEMAGDCNDAVAWIHPGAQEDCDGVDEDCDGVVDEDTGCADDDGDGFAEIGGGDCDDADPTIHPAAVEVCDGVDQDCNGHVDDQTDCFDDDGDGYSELDGDCHDGDAAVFPGAAEPVNGVDDDCDGVIDDGSDLSDDDGDGFSDAGGDCDDGDATVHPAAPEVCDGVDNDCDEAVDEDTGCSDDDGDGYTEDEGDCDDDDPGRAPGVTEVANGVDDDCDGVADEDTEVADDDGDGYAELGGDCDDADPDTYPGADEVVDGLDNDCDGAVDDGTAMYDDDGDGFSEDGGDCDDGDAFSYPGAGELCGDGEDNDCDGEVDEHCPEGGGELEPTSDCACRLGSSPGGGGLGAALLALGALVAIGVRRRRSWAPWLVLALAAVAGMGCDGDEGPQGTLLAAPLTVDLGLVATGSSATATAELTNLGGGPIQLSAVTVEGGDAARFEVSGVVASALDEGETAELQVTYRPTEAGDHQAHAVVTSDAAQSRVKVLLRGSARDPGLVVHGDVLDLGSVVPGTTAEGVVTVSALGPVPVTLRAAVVEPVGSPFSIEIPAALGGALPAVLPPGGVVALPVTFAPQIEGAAHSTLALSGDDHQVAVVSLYGNDCDATYHPDFDADADGVVSCAGDCDDGDPSVYPGAPEDCDGVDDDCDGVVDDGTPCGDDDGDGFAEEDGDCHDGDPEVSPAAQETLDGVDQDCDGVVDEDTPQHDDDGDGYTENGGDCDDGDAAVWPGAVEVCDGVDDDCDGVVDEDTECSDDDGDGFTELEGDCHDGTALIHPGAADSGPGVDWDCDGALAAIDLDGDGFAVEGGDCDDTDPTRHPYAPEDGGAGDGVGNLVDDDCDGAVDEGTTYFDDDGDGWTEFAGDCHDGDPAVHPAHAEDPDGVDNDCDTLVDEGTADADDDGDGYTENGGDCDDADPAVRPGALDLTVDGIDQDCDGTDGS